MRDYFAPTTNNSQMLLPNHTTQCKTILYRHMSYVPTPNNTTPQRIRDATQQEGNFEHTMSIASPATIQTSPLNRHHTSHNDAQINNAQRHRSYLRTSSNTRQPQQDDDFLDPPTTFAPNMPYPRRRMHPRCNHSKCNTTTPKLNSESFYCTKNVSMRTMGQHHTTPLHHHVSPSFPNTS